MQVQTKAQNLTAYRIVPHPALRAETGRQQAKLCKAVHKAKAEALENSTQHPYPGLNLTVKRPL
jgi:hypothetical protein